MSEIFRLLVDVKEPIEEMFSFPDFMTGKDFIFNPLADACREDKLNFEEVHRTVRRNAEMRVKEWNPCVGSYICDLGDQPSGSSANCILGFISPDELIKEAEEWNNHILSGAEKAVTEFLDGRPDGMSMREYLFRLSDFGGNPVSPQSTIFAHNLGRALTTLHGDFQYYDQRYVMDGITGHRSTGIHPEVMENIRKHPEWYAILTIAYDRQWY